MDHNDEVKGEHTKGRLVVVERYDGAKATTDEDDGIALVVDGDVGNAVAWAGNSRTYYPTDGYLDLPNARRLAACWNACEGIDTDMLKPDMLIDTLSTVTELCTPPAHGDGAEYDEEFCDLIEEYVAAGRIPDHGVKADARLKDVFRHVDEVRSAERNRLAAANTRIAALEDSAGDLQAVQLDLDVTAEQLAAAHALLAELADELTTEGMDATVERIRALLPKGGA